MIQPGLPKPETRKRPKLIVPMRSIVPTQLAGPVFVNLAHGETIITEFDVSHERAPIVRVFVIVGFLRRGTMIAKLFKVVGHEA